MGLYLSNITFMDTLIEIITKAAFNLGILGDDGVTINSDRVTKAGLVMQLNNVYRYSVGQVLLNKYSQDFLQFTYPHQTYTSKFIVDASSSGTNLVSTTPGAFANGMETQYIHNPTSGEILKILTYVSDTNITLSTAPVASWSGATCYVLGNEWSFDSVDLSDLNSLVRVDVKYQSTNTEYQRGEWIEVTDFLQLESRFFTCVAPKFFETSINVGGAQVRGFHLAPDPVMYNGAFRLVYTQLPAELVNDTDKPQNITMGLPLLLEYAITEWGAGLVGDTSLRDEYKMRFNEAYAIQVTNYRPRSKGTQNQAWGRIWLDGLLTRDV